MKYLKRLFGEQCWFINEVKTGFIPHLLEDSIYPSFRNFKKYKSIFKIVPLLQLLCGSIFATLGFIVLPLVLIFVLIVFLPLNCICFDDVSKGLGVTINKLFKQFVYDKEK